MDQLCGGLINRIGQGTRTVQCIIYIYKFKVRGTDKKSRVDGDLRCSYADTCANRRSDQPSHEHAQMTYIITEVFRVGLSKIP